VCVCVCVRVIKQANMDKEFGRLYSGDTHLEIRQVI